MKLIIFLSLLLAGSLVQAAPFSEAQFVETYLRKDVKKNTAKPQVKAPVKAVAKPVVIILTPTQKLYSLMGTQSLWTENGAPTALAVSLREALKDSGHQGLNPAHYWTEALESEYTHVTAENAAQFELDATAVLLKYASDLSTGQVDPSKVGDEVKLTKKTLSVEKLVAAMKNTSISLGQSLDSLSPQWSQYQDLQKALMKYSQLEANAFPPVAAPKKKVKIGDKDALFANVKIRLQTLGYPLSENGNVYTKELQSTISRYMEDNSLQGTANMNPGSNFLAHLGTPLEARVQQIRMSMEKLRWLPDAPENRHLVVNLALQRLKVIENGQVVLSMKTINGKPLRMSPMLKDKIVAVELNPAWTVPMSLILKDKLPAIQANPNFLEEHNFRLFDGDMSREMSSYEVDWFNITKQNVGSINLQQRPGLGNALGIMKFHLTNSFAIYLHDTNERNLFPENFRLMSSGCVRLEKPLDLAHYILKDDPKWGNPYEVESRLATSAVADWGVEVQKIIGVKQSLPVYLMYITAEVDDSGVMKFAGDFYGQDTRLFELMKAEGL